MEPRTDPDCLEAFNDILIGARLTPNQKALYFDLFQAGWVSRTANILTKLKGE